MSELGQNEDTPFDIRPDANEMSAIAEPLDLLGLRKLSFVGRISASGADDWLLKAKLGATVVQPCAVSLAPVTTRIDVPIQRMYVQDYVEIDQPEAEMPEDETVEALGIWIDPWAVMIESLDLALPMYPRADQADFGQISVSEPGVTPMTDEDAKPFAGLAGLRDQLSGNRSSDDDTS